METHKLETQFFERPQKQITASKSAPKTERWQRPLLKPLLLGLGLAMIMLLIVGLVAGGTLLINSPLILPGTAVYGINVGGQTKADAAATLNQHWQQQQIQLISDRNSWTVHPAELGILLDSDATIEEAYQQGRSLESWQRMIEQRQVAQWQLLPVQPVWRLEPAVTDVFLAQKADELFVEPQDARIEIVNGRVQIIPAVVGQTLDQAATEALLGENGGQIVENGRLTLITTPIQPAIIDVSQLAQQAEQLLTRSVTIYAYDPISDDSFSWVISPAIWGEWLTLSTNQAEFEWALDNAKAAMFLEQRTAALGEGRYLESDEVITAVSKAIQTQQPNINTRLYHHDNTHTVQAGDTFSSLGRQYGIPYPWIQEANTGVADGLTIGQSIIIPSADVMLPIPVIENKRVVVSISQQKVWVYEDDRLLWEWIASTGIASSPTAPGVFQIQTHEPNAYAGNWDLWMPNFMGIYQPVPNSEFMNGFHGFPTRDGANLLWTNSLGAPVTYGCVLLSNEHVAQLYEWAEAGVVVEIVP